MNVDIQFKASTSIVYYSRIFDGGFHINVLSALVIFDVLIYNTAKKVVHIWVMCSYLVYPSSNNSSGVADCVFVSFPH